MAESGPILPEAIQRRTGIFTVNGRLQRNPENSDVIVITAGVPRKPGMSRDDLLKGKL